MSVTLLVVAALLAQAQSSTSPASPGPHVVRRAYGAMGTEIKLTAWTADEAKAAKAFDAGFDEIRRIEVLMTDWERPGEPESDLVRINKAAGKQAVKVSDDTLAVVEKALDMSRRSDGAFDITFAVMRGLWKFDDDLTKTVPPAAEIARRRKLIDWRQVEVNSKARTVKLRRAGMRIGLGGIAKGFAVDRCAAVLRQEGRPYMVTGGDLYVAGRKGTANWMVGVRDPRGSADKVIAAMPIQDHAFSTAGDYERIVRARRQALPPHHRSQDRLPGDGVAQRDRSARRRRWPPTRSTTRCSSWGRRRGWRWSNR